MMSKVALRREVEKACRMKDELEMKEEMDKLKKTKQEQNRCKRQGLVCEGCMEE